MFRYEEQDIKAVVDDIHDELGIMCQWCRSLESNGDQATGICMIDRQEKALNWYCWEFERRGVDQA
jgi:hypothetical protein